MAVGVTTATQSISLSNFTPRIENLPSSCQSVYTTAIQDCTKDDFTAGARCSAKCVRGLLKISNSVAQGCKSVDVPETSIIGVFLLGAGVPALCPGVIVTTVSSSSTQPPTQISTNPASTTTTSSQAKSTTSSPPPPPSQSSSSASSSSSPASTVTTSTSPQTSQAAAPPPSSTPRTLSIETNTPPPAPSQTNSQQANQAGGGSPFDIGATAASSQIRYSSVAIITMLLLAVTLPILS
ncbi:hypothetical protein CC80DRAFT_399731 [Byssothecium circinans]|uniref:Uncharacterized protein n=1 Tax=Byssothecium circinans TaxID=147558 RepID=A0A6A5UBB6_9PLEO|nr:hypothetical protein CC80DRAFT_399731 [Byssothecium circinans]